MNCILDNLRRNMGIIFPTTILVLSIIELAGSYILLYNQGLKNSFLPVATVWWCHIEPLKFLILIIVVSRAHELPGYVAVAGFPLVAGSGRTSTTADGDNCPSD